MHRFKLVMKWLLALLFVAAGVYHFVNPAFYVRIMPPYLPAHEFLVYLSGAFEILVGVLLLVPAWTAPAAWGVVALLIAFLPVHAHMVVNADSFPSYPVPFLWGRLAFQAVLIAWAYWFTGERPPAAEAP